jgi:hypothetical protein
MKKRSIFKLIGMLMKWASPLSAQMMCYRLGASINN